VWSVSLGANPQATAVPEQNFKPIARSIAEQKQMSARRLEFEAITHQSVQSIEAFSHIGGSHRQVDLGRRSYSKHRFLRPFQYRDESFQCPGVKSRPHLDPPSAGEHYFQCGARPTIPIGLPPGQLHRDKPAALLCIAFVQAPPFELALQGAQRQTVIPAKLVLSQSTRFKFKQQPLDLLTASSLPPRDFLVFSH
jgi:hypothetical protein